MEPCPDSKNAMKKRWRQVRGAPAQGNAWPAGWGKAPSSGCGGGVRSAAGGAAHAVSAKHGSPGQFSRQNGEPRMGLEEGDGITRAAVWKTDRQGSSASHVLQ